MSQNPHEAPHAIVAFCLFGGALLLNVLVYQGRPQAIQGPFDQMAQLSPEDHLADLQFLLQRARSLQAWSESTKTAELAQRSESAWMNVLERIFAIDRPRPEAPLLDQNEDLQKIFSEVSDYLYGSKSQREAASLVAEFKARAAQAQACVDRSRSSRDSGAEQDRQAMIRRAKQQWQRVFGLLTLLQNQKQYGDGKRFNEALEPLGAVLAQSQKMLHDLTIEARPGDFDSAQFNKD